jgi:hypothetical protein
VKRSSLALRMQENSAWAMSVRASACRVDKSPACRGP